MANRSLSVKAAEQLIEFIFSTNYLVAAFGDGCFNSKSEALAHVHSCKYKTSQPLSICFETKQEDYWESAEVTFDGTTWFVEDTSMGGHKASGKTINEAIENFRLTHNPACKYYPAKLIVKKHN